jgi:hypothetical protein
VNVSATLDRELRPFDRARRLARERRAPVFVAGGEVLLEKPKGASATVWPNGTVTWGSATMAARDIERRLTPPAA